MLVMADSKMVPIVVATLWLVMCTLVSATPDGVLSVCPQWEENPWCPCFNNAEGIFLECPMVSLQTVSSVLSLFQTPVQRLSIYDLDTNVTFLPQGIFSRSAGVSNLQISHSNLKSVSEGSFLGLEHSLESLIIKHCKLSAIPKPGTLHRLSKLSALDLEMNNITELPRFGFTRLKLKSLNLKGNMISLISDFAFDGLEDSLEELNLINNDLKQLPLRSLQKLKIIGKLEAAWNHITELTTDDSSPFVALKYLDLSSNNIRKIKSNSLVGLPALKYLSLYMNSISNIAKDAFRENSALETLFLGHNNIRHLDPKIFSYTPSLQVIDLGNNNIQIIGGLFNNLPDLHELVLSRNNIREISENTFQNSSNIKLLNLENNAIRFVESDTFKDMTHLKMVLLSHNNIQEVSPHLFALNHRLEILKLDNNRIANLDEMMFKNSTKLKKLFAQENKIKQIDRGLFSRALDLTEIHLQGNKIEVVATGAFSGLRKLEELNLQDNEVLALPDTFSHDSSSIRNLRLSGNNLNSLQDYTLKGQRQLDFLWLDHNNISVLVNGVFGDLVQLRELHLEDNHIAAIHDEVFKNMKSLRKLLLSSNFLEIVGENIFQGLSSLRELNLANNKIRSILPNAFQHLGSLEKLNLSRNELVVIQKDYFGAEIPLKILIVDNSQISEIEEGSFEALMKLDSLSLQGNNLHHLQEGFLKLTQLRSLDLRRNSFQILDINSFAGLPNLEVLDLGECDIEALPEGFFEASIALKSLNLEGNKLKSLSHTVFSGLSDLTKLDISGNKLSMESCRSFLIMRNLEYLSLTSNPIKYLCTELERLDRLKELHISNIGLETINTRILQKLTSLTVLDISENMIEDVPVGSFRSSTLQNINFADNQLTQVPDALFIDGVPGLKVLDMSGNPLRRLTGTLITRGINLSNLEELTAIRSNLTVLTSLELSHMPSLRTLSFEGSAISKVSPGAFRSLSQLSHLHMGFNHLEILPRERLRGLHSLTYLNLTRNRLKKIDQLPVDSANLKILDVSGNMLTELEEHTFKHSTGLEELQLSDNWITTINPHTLEPLTRLRLLDLSQNNIEILTPRVLHPIESSLEVFRVFGNPLTCGCETMDLWSWLQHQSSRVVQHPRDITCDLPESLRGEPFLLLPSASFCPQPLILRLAIQDIQSQSLLVSWQATNSSAIYGFKVTHQVTSGISGEGTAKQAVTSDDPSSRQGVVVTSPTLGLSSRTYLLQNLRPATTYRVCIRGLASSLPLASSYTKDLIIPGDLARSHTVAQDRDNEDQNDGGDDGGGVKCSLASTLPLPASPSSGISGLDVGVILGVTLAAAVLLGVLVVLLWCCLCRDPHQHQHNTTKTTAATATNGNTATANSPTTISSPDYYSNHHHHPLPPHHHNHHNLQTHRRIPQQDDDDEEFAC